MQGAQWDNDPIANGASRKLTVDMRGPHVPCVAAVGMFVVPLAGGARSGEDGTQKPRGILQF